MEPSRPPPSMGKRLFDIVKVVLYMLRKGFSKQKLMMMDLLLKRGKIAGKALSNFISFHHHHHHHHGAAAATYPFHNHREVEFSCSNTPAYPSLHLPTKRSKNKHHHHRSHHENKCEYDAAAIAMAFEILNCEASDGGDQPLVVATPSPAVWNFGKSPVAVRPLRITDSPFPVREEGEVADGKIDKEAEEFIRSFYDQLRRQQMLPPTPEYCSVCRRVD